MSGQGAAVLAREVSCAGGYKPFGEMTAVEVRSRADDFAAAAEVGPMAPRMAPVASAWRGLADQMERDGAAKVAELGGEVIAARAERLRVVPPGGSLLR